ATAATRGGQSGAAARGVDLGAMDTPPAEAVLADPVVEAVAVVEAAPAVEAAPVVEAVAVEATPEA
ncbi:MAG: hypothetical protein ABL918_08320, partial [Chakrabartia sp.]